MKSNVSIKKYYFIIGIIFFVFLISILISLNKPKQLNITFEVSEGNSLIEVETEHLSKAVLNKEDTFYGLLQDTSVLNMLYSYRFEGGKAFLRRYYLKDRVYKDPKNPVWVKISGKYSNVEYGKEEIDATNFEIMNEIIGKVENAEHYSCDAVNGNVMYYDLNNYKNTERFNAAFPDFKNTNLNTLKFRPGSSLTFIDFNKMIAGFDCGERILRETVIRGDLLTYEAIYDLNNENLIKVIIINTGYFME